MPERMREQIKAQAVENAKDRRGRLLAGILLLVAAVSLALAGVALYAALTAPEPVAPPCPSSNTVPRWVEVNGEFLLVCALT